MSWIRRHECLDDLTQSRKGQVDIDAFFGSVACGLGFLLPFGASQIDQVEFSSFDFGLAIDDFFLFDPDHEDAVAA